MMQPDQGSQGSIFSLKASAKNDENLARHVLDSLVMEADMEENITVGELLQKMCAKEKERIWANHAAEVERLQALVQSQLKVAKVQVS
mmetsp:Transcript_47664/g.87623  ORF Transcript_47664/g.87623 Transcript_47664/m.87623 type:complete len:88 (-) Transcript_47664:70-333(-)